MNVHLCILIFIILACCISQGILDCGLPCVVVSALYYACRQVFLCSLWIKWEKSIQSFAASFAGSNGAALKGCLF